MAVMTATVFRPAWADSGRGVLGYDCTIITLPARVDLALAGVVAFQFARAGEGSFTIEIDKAELIRALNE